MNVWINFKGEEIPYNEMDDSYLFNTIKVLWNYFAEPKDTKAPVKEFDLSKVYEIDFLLESLASLILELRSRNNSKFQWSDNLYIIRSYNHEIEGFENDWNSYQQIEDLEIDDSKINKIAITHERRTRQFREKYITKDVKLALYPDFDIQIKKGDKKKRLEGVLLGVFSPDSNFLEFPFDRENSSIPSEDREMYLGLKKWGKRINLIELTETNISFNPLLTKQAKTSRNLRSNPKVFRNPMGEIESIYSLQSIVSLAAHYHKAKVILDLKTGKSTTFIGLKI